MKKLLSLFMVCVMVLGMNMTVFASNGNNSSQTDPYTIEGQYVDELVELTAEEISELSLEDAKALFQKAFLVSANDYSEDEIRLALDGLAFGLKFQKDMEAVKAVTEHESAYQPVGARSSTGNKYYTGEIGVAWVRDTTSGHSPLTLGEILSGTYTLEVDYITWDTAASILTASLNESAFDQLVNYVGSNAAGTVIGNYIVKALGLKGKVAVVTTVVIGAAVAKGWDWFRHFDRDRMNTCFQDMVEEDHLMKVQFMWASDMVNRLYTNVTKSNTISNPFPGTYGDWYTDKYGYLYNY